ncbi:Xaa-Pro aminopeptidase 3 isoform X1 [Biomphalaria glabrata]|nr:Xaa-Pro aminopeptidase 3 isoform X1 [Biomphalaria glabrata]
METLQTLLSRKAVIMKVISFRRLFLPFTSHVRYFGQPAAQTHPHLIAEGEVTPGISRKEIYTRRCKLVTTALDMFKGMKSAYSHLFIFPSATTQYMTNDIPYVFRQNSDFLYFSGFQEPDSLLLIEASGNKSSRGEHIANLFVPRKDPAKELWDGPRSGTEGAIALTGVDGAFNSNELEKYLHHYNKTHKDYVLWYNHAKPIHQEFHNQVLGQVLHDKRYKCVENTAALAHRLRVLKSQPEIRLIQQSITIACESFIEVMKFSKPQANEAHLWAKMDFECRMRGAEFLAYPPVVAGGPRANVIHYITNNQVIKDGHLVLMDAGCEFHGYASDLTRTWPVSGRFTEPQRLLYNATLRVQEMCIQMCTTDYSLDDIYNQMVLLLSAELTQLGIISPDTSYEQKLNLTRKFCPHHVGHYLGMDIHDTSLISRQIKLQPNMIVTIEPGLYIAEDDYTVSPEFRGIGLRIEDNILVTDSVPVNMSASCPKTVDDIETVLSSQ